MKLIITGQTPSKKNNKQLYKNRTTGKMFIASSDTSKAWEYSASVQLLRYRIKEPFENKVRVDYNFFVQDNRRRDIDNMITSVNDILMKARIIQDDSWQWLEIGSGKAEIDKSNPRVEISIQDIS